MTVFSLELKRGRLALIIWTAAIAAMLAISILIYPEMKAQMDALGEMFSDMGSFSEAFGMDMVNFGEFKGYFATECGNVLGLGGALYAAILGIAVLSKEQKDRTADFLLTHPISRRRVCAEKLLAVYVQILILNLAVAVVSLFATLAIGERIDAKIFVLIFLAFFLMQIEIASIMFGLSAFISSSGIGIGIGVALLLYFLNIIANITEKTEFLKYITPFAYADSAAVASNACIEARYLAVGAAFTVIALAAGFIKFDKKDI